MKHYYYYYLLHYYIILMCDWPVKNMQIYFYFKPFKNVYYCMQILIPLLRPEWIFGVHRPYICILPKRRVLQSYRFRSDAAIATSQMNYQRIHLMMNWFRIDEKKTGKKILELKIWWKKPRLYRKKTAPYQRTLNIQW